MSASSSPPPDNGADAQPDDIDVGALLSAVVDKPPPADLADRVMSRLALVETVVEFGRLFGLVPAEMASDAIGTGKEGDDDEG
jgi:hypothetical protein